MVNSQLNGHGEIKTPVFMAVGTAATVKGVHQIELKDEYANFVRSLKFDIN